MAARRIKLLMTLFAGAKGLAVASAATTAVHHHASSANLGEVAFSTSCKKESRASFNHAVALLHSFDFGRAIDGFNAVLKYDPHCAMAYWGMALSDWSNPFAPGQKDPGQLNQGRQNVLRGTALQPPTARETAYLAAVGKLYENFESAPQRTRLIGYRDAMRSVAAKYPQDSEAQIFYALALAAAASPEDKSYADQLEAGAILEKLFAQQPTHPGLAHYIIHAYDVPALADRASAAADRYSRIAPDAPHALHMPSHTFTRLGNWQASIDSNIAAASAAQRQGQTAEELHASDYETYAYLQMGMDEAARKILNALPAIVSRFDPKAVLIGAGPPAAGYFALAAIPARFALERRDWPRAENLVAANTPFPYADAITWFAKGLGAARQGHAAPANEAIAMLQRLREQLLNAHDPYWPRQVEIQAAAVAAWISLGAGKREDALRQMEAAAKLEDGTEKSVVTPGPLAPARELLGEMLLELKRPADALSQFEETLKHEPRRFRSIYGAAKSAALSGDAELSRKYYRKLLKICAHPDEPVRPEIIEARRAAALTD